MIQIHSDLIIRLEERILKLKKIYGKTNTPKTKGEYVNAVLKKNLDKHDEQERSQKNKGSNYGITWKVFKSLVFNEIYLRDAGRCVYCTKRVSRKESTLDHKLPVLRGGLNTAENVVVSCLWCNQDKGVLTDEEYYYKQLVNAGKGIKPN